jgi:hypothetical protein
MKRTVNMMLIRRIRVLALAASLLPGAVFAQDLSNASANASAGVSQATAVVVAGSVSVLATTASLAVMALETIGESAVVVLTDLSAGASVSIKASGEALGQGSVAVGTVLSVAAGAAGYAIYHGSHLIAFIPNEIGKSLVHHSKLTK